MNLQEAWVARMRLLMRRMTGPACCYGLDAHDEVSRADQPFGVRPLFVTQRYDIASGETHGCKAVQVSPLGCAVSEGTNGF